jgi:hypothetical protein
MQTKSSMDFPGGGACNLKRTVLPNEGETGQIPVYGWNCCRKRKGPPVVSGSLPAFFVIELPRDDDRSPARRRKFILFPRRMLEGTVRRLAVRPSAYSIPILRFLVFKPLVLEIVRECFLGRVLLINEPQCRTRPFPRCCYLDEHGTVGMKSRGGITIRATCATARTVLSS